jgi:hypothetical protein
MTVLTTSPLDVVAPPLDDITEAPPVSKSSRFASVSRSGSTIHRAHSSWEHPSATIVRSGKARANAAPTP